MANPIQAHNREEILVIDDSSDNLNLLEKILSSAGYRVYLAPSSKMAFRFMQSNLPDLILLDIMMPQMDGYTVCEYIKSCQRTQQIPVIFISALQEVFDKAKAFSLGAADYITKPFQPQEVLMRVENQLRLQRMSKQLIDQNILQERNRIAQEIHDTLAQTFTGIILHLEVTERAMNESPEQMLTHIKTAYKLAKDGIAEARRSVRALRPQVLEQNNLATAFEQIIQQMSLNADVCIEFDILGIPYTLPLHIEDNVLRIGQEAFTNALRHAQATHIRVELIYETAQLMLHVIDNGQGFDVGRAFLGNGFGLPGIRERAERIGAKAFIHSQPGNGTTVQVCIDLAILHEL